MIGQIPTELFVNRVGKMVFHALRNGGNNLCLVIRSLQIKLVSG